MYFVPCELDRTLRREKSDLRKLLTRIIESGNECVEIKDFTHKNVNSFATSLRDRIKKDRLCQLTVVTKNQRIFVINTLLVKDVK